VPQDETFVVVDWQNENAESDAAPESAAEEDTPDA